MSNLLDKASIVLTPTAYDNSKVLCVKPSDGSGDFDFSRATEATRINSLGLVEVVADNLPRINYEGGCGSWLWENQSTNLIPYSENFNTWNNLGSRSTVTLNSIISPDGTLNGTKQTQNAVSNSVRLRFSSILTIGTEYTFSVFAKKGNHDKLVMNISGVTTNFTLTDNWVRYEITATAPNNTFVDVGISQGSIGDFIYLWGAQAEEQSFATSYIPTSGTSVTRNQDLCINGGSVATISSTSGVLYAEIAALADDLTLRSICLSDGQDENRVSISYNNQTNELIFSCRVNDVNEFLFTKTLADTTTFHKVALSYKLNEFKVYIDGVQESVQLSGSVYPANTLNELTFDRGLSSFPFFGKNKCLAVWKETLTDTERAELTTI